MFKRLISIILILTIALGIVGCNNANIEVNKELFISNGTTVRNYSEIVFNEIANNGILSLELCENTTMFRVKNLASGATYCSGWDNSERTLANITLTYFDDSGVLHTLNSFTNAVKLGQFKVENQKNGFKVKYSLGSVDGIVYAPKIIKKERYEKFYNLCDASGKKIMSQVYKLVDIKTYDPSSIDKTLEKYPQAKDGPIYVQKVDKLQSAIEKKLHTALEKAGYTDEDYEIDAEFSKASVNDENVAFNVVMSVLIDNNTLKIIVPENEINNLGKATIQDVNVLPNFSRFEYGAQGYYLLPDGSGSVMNFFNGKNMLQEYSVNIYGVEETIKENEKVYNTQQAVLPIFGCHSDNSGWLAIIDEGDALANVHAAPGDDKTASYAYASFKVLQTAKINAISSSSTESSNSFYLSTQNKKRDGNLSVSYHFLSENDSDYSGMAQYYKLLLFKNRNEIASNGKLPLFVDIIGSINVDKKKFGFTSNKEYIMTTPEQAYQICDTLSETVDELQPILSGYGDGGYSQYFLKSSKISKLLENTMSILRKKGFKFTVGYETLYASKGGFLRNVPNKYISRMLTRDVALLYECDPSYFNFDETSVGKYVLNNKGISIAFDNVKSIIEKNKLDSIALFSVGKTINSDYNENNEIERQKSLSNLVANIDKLQNTDLIISTGNAPIAKMVNTVIDLPLTSSNYDITDYSVPFVAMVYSGYLGYSGNAFNLYYSDESDFLRLVESGAAPYCIVTGQNNEELRGTSHNDLYSIDFNYLKDKIENSYNKVQNAIGDCYGVAITEHERLMDNVFKTTFASGTYVIVNYNSISVTVDGGVVVQAKSFVKGTQ